mmetsp:Transcript_32460/g.52582  ORF Transcript_32460/g.52582 Transcript_32460/m.52582 type:complete len:287 (-) Transcript_32460:465-1325(-)
MAEELGPLHKQGRKILVPDYNRYAFASKGSSFSPPPCPWHISQPLAGLDFLRAQGPRATNAHVPCRSLGWIPSLLPGTLIPCHHYYFSCAVCSLCEGALHYICRRVGPVWSYCLCAGPSSDVVLVITCAPVGFCEAMSRLGWGLVYTHSGSYPICCLRCSNSIAHWLVQGLYPLVSLPWSFRTIFPACPIDPQPQAAQVLPSLLGCPRSRYTGAVPALEARQCEDHCVVAYGGLCCRRPTTGTHPVLWQGPALESRCLHLSYSADPLRCVMCRKGNTSAMAPLCSP